MAFEDGRTNRAFSNPMLSPQAGTALQRFHSNSADVRVSDVYVGGKQQGVQAVGQHSTLPVCRESNYCESEQDATFFFRFVSSFPCLHPLPSKFTAHLLPPNVMVYLRCTSCVRMADCNLQLAQSKLSLQECHLDIFLLSLLTFTVINTECWSVGMTKRNISLKHVLFLQIDKLAGFP